MRRVASGALWRSGFLVATALAVALVACGTHSSLKLQGPSPTSSPSPTPIAWWNPAWLYRMEIDVTAPAGAPAGYSISLPIPHATLVLGGRARPDGSDVRIVDETATELDRVLDDGADWNSAGTKVWFRSSTAIPSGTTARYWLYYGNPSAISPPSNFDNVFLLHDDFESGLLSKWTQPDAVVYTNSLDRGHHGVRSLKCPAVNQADRRILAAGLDESDVWIDAWWYVTGNSNDGAQVVRASAPQTNQYEADHASSAPLGFDVSKMISGVWSEIAPPPAGPPAILDSWHEVGFGIQGTLARLQVDGTNFYPGSGTVDVGTQLASGTVGFMAWIVPSTGWYIDDVSVRRYVEPEPIATLGAEEAKP